MRVKFMTPYFAPGSPHRGTDGRTVGGRFYRQGIHDVPDGMPLPPSALVLNGKEEQLPIPVQSLRDFDAERAASDQEVAVRETARTKRRPGRPKKYE